jgi:hypothetical protein
VVFVSTTILSVANVQPSSILLLLQVGVLKEIRIDSLDLGTRPPRIDCFKSYETTEDELIIEVRSRQGHGRHAAEATSWRGVGACSNPMVWRHRRVPAGC